MTNTFKPAEVTKVKISKDLTSGSSMYSNQETANS